MATPAGWKETGTNTYSAEFSTGGSRYAYDVNTSTGQRQVYQVNEGLGLNTRTPVMTINADGTVTKGSGYQSQLDKGGQASIDNLVSNSRTAASSLLTATGTTSTSSLANTSEYKSTIGNSSTSATQSTSTSTAALQLDVGDGVIRKSYNKGTPLVYPTGVDLTTQDYIKFDMFRFVPKKFTDVTNSTDPFSAFEERELKEIMGTVILPIQSSISDTTAVDWTDDNSLNSFKAYLVKTAVTGMKDLTTIGAGMENTIMNVTKDKGMSEGIKNAVQLQIAQDITGTKGLLSRTTGAVLNPNLELVFQGPQLRNFAFSFLLSPRSEEEAIVVRRIIRFFKQGMAVKRSVTELFLKAPNIFRIRYIHGKTQKEHRSINMIKTCALKSCNVDYTPNGTYMTFDDEDSTMTSYRLNLQFGEIEPIYDDQYLDPDANSGDGDTTDSESIGY